MSIRTEKAYVQWAKRCILSHHKRHPADMGAPEIRAFLIYLAVEGQIAASTHNVALQALVFLYRHVLKQPFPELEDLEHAKKSRRVPVVLLVEPADAALLRDREHVTAIAEFASGIGPGKLIVGDQPQIVGWAHEAGLRVTPWTFRTATIGRFDSVAAEIQHYLVEVGVDSVITDHPDAWPDEPRPA